MPKYYCDYCDTYLTHDSPSVRRTHNQGRNHKENVRKYYQDWLEEQAQKLIDTTTAAFKAGKLPLGAARAALANSIIRPALPLSSPFFMPPPQAIGPAGVNPVLAGPNPFFPVPPPGPMAQSPFFSQGVPPHPPQAQFMFAPPAIAGFHPQGPPPPMTGFAPQGPPPNLTGFHHQGPPPPIPGFHPQGPPPPITGFHPQGPPPPIPGFHPQGPYPPPQGFPVSTTNSDGQSMFSPPPPFPPPPTLNIPPPNLPQPPPHLRKPPPPTSQSMNPGQQQ